MEEGIWKQLLRSKLGMASLAVLVVLYLAALLAPWLAPYEPNVQNLNKTFHPPTALTWADGGLAVKIYESVDPASADYRLIDGETVPIEWFRNGNLFQLDTKDTEQRIYLLGSDSTGRDVFSRLLYGARISLSIGLIGITITTVIGFFVGAMSGYLGGLYDSASMRFVEFLMAIPSLYLLLALRSALAPHFPSEQMFLMIVIALAFVNWSGTARVIRGMTLSVKQRQYVIAAESMGQSRTAILLRHVLPNISGYLLVAATLSIPSYILSEAALSFLGLGIQEPASSWGLMLSQAQSMKVFMLNFWWLLTPGAAIFVTVIAYNVLGDVLRDIVDPKMQTR